MGDPWLWVFTVLMALMISYLINLVRKGLR